MLLSVSDGDAGGFSEEAAFMKSFDSRGNGTQRQSHVSLGMLREMQVVRTSPDEGAHVGVARDEVGRLMGLALSRLSFSSHQALQVTWLG